MKFFNLIILSFTLCLSSFAGDMTTIRVNGKIDYSGNSIMHFVIIDGEVSVHTSNKSDQSSSIFKMNKDELKHRDLLIEILKDASFELLPNPSQKLADQVIVYEGEEVKLLDALNFLSFLEECSLFSGCDDEVEGETIVDSNRKQDNYKDHADEMNQEFNEYKNSMRMGRSQ